MHKGLEVLESGRAREIDGLRKEPFQFSVKSQQL